MALRLSGRGAGQWLPRRRASRPPRRSRMGLGVLDHVRVSPSKVAAVVSLCGRALVHIPEIRYGAAEQRRYVRMHVRARGLSGSSRLACAGCSAPQLETAGHRRFAVSAASPGPAARAPREPCVTCAPIACSKVVSSSSLLRVAERVNGAVAANAKWSRCLD